MTKDFRRLGISEWQCESLRSQQIIQPTAVQVETIPPMLAGRDLIVRSQTGTGKTLAYILPILENVKQEEKHLQAIVLVPTRELGAQIMEVLAQLTDEHPIRSLLLIGGASLSRQLEKLKSHPHIAAGTPGRVLELIKLRKLKMHKVRTIVVDEADQVFALGAADEVDGILNSALRDRQVVFCSATLSETLQQAADAWMKSPIQIGLSLQEAIPASIEHIVFECERRDKIDQLKKILRAYQPQKAMIFINEIDSIGEIEAKLQYDGFNLAALYSDMGKQERTQVITRFRRGSLPLLLTTDVASRGLDIRDVTHIVHFDPALDADHYVHRSGRTGRMGQKGTSVSLITAQERFILEKFARQLAIEFIDKEMYGGQVIPPRKDRKRGDRSQIGNQSTIGKPSRRKLSNPNHPTPKKRSYAQQREQQAVNKNSIQRKHKKRREAEEKNKGAPRWLKKKNTQKP